MELLQRLDVVVPGGAVDNCGRREYAPLRKGTSPAHDQGPSWSRSGSTAAADPGPGAAGDVDPRSRPRGTWAGAGDVPGARCTKEQEGETPASWAETPEFTLSLLSASLAKNGYFIPT